MAELTEKQRAFVRAVLEPGESGKSRTLSEAYREAYAASGMSPATVRKRASELRAHGGIAGAIAEGIASRERREARDGLNRRRGILMRLDAIADDSGNPAAARVAALKLLGEAEGGIFTHRTEVALSGPDPKTEADTLAELELTLREALH